MSFVITNENYSGELQSMVGGKAKNLFHLQRQGIPVPDFFCVSVAAFYQHIAAVKSAIAVIIAQCDFECIDSVNQASSRLKAMVLDAEIPEELTAQIDRRVDGLQGWKSFSVRSSATREDSLKHSFAGQFGTWLNVSRDQIAARIKDCWASAFEPGVLSYQHQMGIDPADTGVSVVVQGMVDAQSAGVLFQADPRKGLSRLLVVAGFGLGEGIVGDKVETDLYTYNRQTRDWQLEINHKSTRLCYDESGGTRVAAVDAGLAEQPVLDQAQREALLKYSEQIAGIYDHYQDIEWAFDRDNSLYILQSRPITTISRGTLRVFDNSNIAESYPGVVLPMTFSIFSLDYYNCMKQALIQVGVPDYLVKKHDGLFKGLVGYIYGRAFYNIGNWYRVFLLSPFFRSRIIRYFDEMIGTTGSFSSAHDDLGLSRWDRFFTKIKFSLSFLSALLRHDKLIEKYTQRAKSIQRQFESVDVNNASSDHLIGQLRRQSQQFMELLGIPLINDFFTMVFMAFTKERLAKLGVTDAQSVLNTLLYNQEIESAKPVQSMNALIETVRQDEALRHQLSGILDRFPPRAGADKLYSVLNDCGFHDFSRQLQQHILAYGHRSPKELIMEQDTYRENPLALLKFVLVSSGAPAEDRGKAKGTPVSLEEIIKRSKCKPLMRWLIKKTRQSIAYREATRLDRGLHFSFFRTLIKSIGRRLVEEGALARQDDIFYVTMDELDAYRKGCTPDCNLQALVDYRKTQVEEWKQKEVSEMIFCSGSVFVNNPEFFGAPDWVNTGQLCGTGCSEGEVTSAAKIVTDPNDSVDIEGKILVSESTDPGWVFIMSKSAGLISERGSPLSHTAIIGRELGIPTVVGVKQITKIIEDGQILSMNGKTGEIAIEQRQE